MELQKRKLLTVITESSLESTIIKAIKQFGAKGYTLVNAQGEGARGVRKGDWDENRNIIIQTVCKEDVAHSIMDHLYNTYYDDYAMIAHVSDIEIHRPEKF